jgi:DNA-binding winged helix-turn-helix (wHTH) protein/tetratricopeptide (TPR) repeat protein
MSVKKKELYEFGEFRLDVAEHLLVRSSGDEEEERLPLSDKAFETLCVLVRNAGHLVNKDELLNQVWAEAFVEENNLNKCIHAIRRVLGEQAGARQYIETVQKRGYRFVAEVRRISVEVERKGQTDATETTNGLSANASHHSIASASLLLPFAAAQKTPPSGAVIVLADWRHETEANEAAAQISIEDFDGLNSSPAEPESRGRHAAKNRLPLAAFASAAFLIGVIALGFYFFSAGKTISNADGKKSIAVLPLKPINTGVRDEIYEVGIADSLILRLSSANGFFIRPLSATRKYTALDQDALAAGREQKTDYVLAANYQLADGKIRVTAQLLNVATGQIEETYKSEKDSSDVFAMQDAVAGEIGGSLLARFVTPASRATAKRGTNNEEAYRLWLQAMYLYDRRDRADAQKAVELLEQAIQLDPEFARAWAGKAHVHRALANFSGTTHEEYKKSIEAINRALALDENLSDAHSALCENKFFYERDLDGAERECKRAIELDPNSSLAHQIYSRNLMVLERFDESIAEIKTAIDLEPTSLFSQRNFGIAYYYARRYPEAVTQFKRVTEMDSNFEATYPWLINSLKLQGKETEAFDWFMKWQEVRKADEETLKAFRAAYQTSGWRGVGRERVKRFDESKIRTYFMEACMAAQEGSGDKALEYLEHSFERREWGMAYIRFEPALDILRGDPRFDELVRRVRLESRVAIR